MLVPPDTVVPANLRLRQPDANSIESRPSRNTIVYQRPFRARLDPSLTDLRSMRNTLSSKTSFVSSSVIPGVGYVSGKAVYWVGEKILNGVITVECYRRLWVIKRVVKRSEKLPEEARRRWAMKKEKHLSSCLDDLLELSS